MQLPYFCNMRFGFGILILSMNCTKDQLCHHSLTHPCLSQKVFCLSLESRPRPRKDKVTKIFLIADTLARNCRQKLTLRNFLFQGWSGKRNNYPTVPLKKKKKKSSGMTSNISIQGIFYHKFWLDHLEIRKKDEYHNLLVKISTSSVITSSKAYALRKKNIFD